MTHLQPKDLCLYPCARDVLYIQDSTVIKPHLVNSPPSCQTLEVPLCPDFELACPPVASEKAKQWVCVFLYKENRVRQPRLRLWSMSEASGSWRETNTSSFYHLKDPTGLFNFQPYSRSLSKHSVK